MAVFSRIKTWVNGEVLTAPDLNNEFDNIVTNMAPTGIEDASATVSAMQASVSPGGLGSESLATNLLGEITRLRYVIKRFVALDLSKEWYEAPTRSFADLKVVAADMEADSVETAAIKDLNVTTPKIADGNVTTAKLADGAVTKEKLAPLAKMVTPNCIQSIHVAGAVPSIPPGMSTSITTSGRNVQIFLEGRQREDALQNSEWKLWQMTGTETEVTAAVQAGTATAIFNGVLNQGCLIQGARKFNKIIMNVTLASSVIPPFPSPLPFEFTYWNGSSWATLFSAWVELESTGLKSFTFVAPNDWVVGDGSYSADASLYTIRAQVVNSGTSTVQINNLILQDYIGASQIVLAAEGTGTTVSTLQVNNNANFTLQRHTNPAFPDVGLVTWSRSFPLSGAAYDGEFLVMSIPPEGISFIDDNQGLGLAAGTYYYRLYASSFTLSNPGFLELDNVRLRIEEVM